MNKAEEFNKNTMKTDIVFGQYGTQNHTILVFGSPDAQFEAAELRKKETIFTPLGFTKAMAQLHEDNLDMLDDIAEQIANEIGQEAFERDYLTSDIVDPRIAQLAAGQQEMPFLIEKK